MYDKGDGGKGLGTQVNVRTLNFDLLRIRSEIGFSFDADQFARRSRLPLLPRNEVVRAAKRMNPATHNMRELGNGPRFRTALLDQPANQAENIPDTVIQLGNQKLLMLLRLGPVTKSRIGHPQDHFKERQTKRFRRTNFGRLPRSRRVSHNLLPGLKALARRQSIPMGALQDGLVRIAGPSDGFRNLPPEENNIVSRRT